MTRWILVPGITATLALATAGCGGAGDGESVLDRIPREQPRGEAEPEAEPPEPEAEPPEPDPRYRDHLERAVELWRQGNFDGALEAAGTALVLAPTVSDSYRLVSKMFSETGREAAAVDFFHEMTERFPSLPDPWYYKGFHAFHLNLWDEAAEAFRQASAVDPSDPEHPTRLGFILRYQGEFDAALEAFRKAYELDPGNPQRLVNLVEILRLAGDYEGAEQALRGADPSAESAELQHALAKIHMREGRSEEAEKALRRAIELDPGLSKAYKDLAGVLHRTDRVDEAERTLAVAARWKDYAKRKDFLRKRLGVAGDNPTLALLMGELELTEGKHAAALRWFARAEALGGPADRVAAGRAEAYFGLGRNGYANAELGKLASSSTARAYLPAAARQLSEGDRRRAVALLESAVAEGPKERGFLRRAADLYARAGEREIADELLERAAAVPYEAAP